ncbi:MAG: SanA/YdcF family protein [Bacteroidota bacterium]
MKLLFYKSLLRKIVVRSFLFFSVVFVFMLACNLWVIHSTRSRIYSSVEEIPFNEVGVVPGAAKTLGGRFINPYFKYRMEAAAQLFHAGKIKHILVTGDNHSCNYDEPTDMKNYLVSLGVPENCITLDYAGFRTFDSMVRAKKIFGLSKFTIISQEFHNQRALFICDHYEIDAVAFNANDPYMGPATHTREWLAKTKAVMDLYVLFTQPRFLGGEEQMNTCVNNQ